MVTSSISLSRISIPKQTILQRMDPVRIKRLEMIVIWHIAAPRLPHLTEVQVPRLVRQPKTSRRLRGGAKALAFRLSAKRLGSPGPTPAHVCR